MSFWNAVVIIVAIAAFVELRKSRYRAQAGILRDNSGNESAIARIAADDVALQREVEDLRERVRVLERIVTDNRPARDLALEIESLRDKTPDTTGA